LFQRDSKEGTGSGQEKQGAESVYRDTQAKGVKFSILKDHKVLVAASLITYPLSTYFSKAERRYLLKTRNLESRSIHAGLAHLKKP
jgi:hypothetical protein